MAQEMHRQFLLEPNQPDYTWDPDRMHIFCFCHKMALIVGAGLGALGLKTAPPMKIKNALRGTFPDFNSTITEEGEEGEDPIPLSEIADVAEAPDDPESDEELSLQAVVSRSEEEDEPVIQDPDEEEDWDAADAADDADAVLLAEKEAGQPQPTHRREANKLDALMDKVSISPLLASTFFDCN